MQNLRDKNVVVTGAGGFIGSHLVETLVPLCAKVTAVIHYDSRADWSNLEYLPADIKDNLEIISGDVSDAHQVQRMVKGNSVVFHLAALITIPFSYQAPTTYYQTNAIGTINVLEAVRFFDVERLVVTSTSETYGTALAVPMDETHPLQAQSPYSASKISADKAAESYYCSFNTPVVILRPFNTFGPRQSARAIIPTIISQALSNSEQIKLGSLTPVRDMTYVADTVSGFIAAATTPGIEGDTINLGVGEGVSIGELAERILSITDIDKPIVADEQRVRPGKSEVMRLISDNSKAKNKMGWSPQYSLDEGLSETINFVKEYQSRFKSDLYLV